jgi:hypothetical protein
MRTAIGARAYYVLGATLIACMLLQTADAAQSDSTSFGIDQGALTGIDQGAVLGIDQGALTGIDQGAVLGIDQGALTGIDQGAVLGIDQGALTGIDQGATQRTMITGLVLAGPVSSIDRINGVFESMGQIVLASQSMLSSMRIGDYVSVNGSVISGGWLYADNVSVFSESYVPGASPVFVTGIPSAMDLSTGRAQIGGLTIDYTPALSSGDLGIGLEMSFSGIQPVSRGLLISDAVSVR